MQTAIRRKEELAQFMKCRASGEEKHKAWTEIKVLCTDGEYPVLASEVGRLQVDRR